MKTLTATKRLLATVALALLASTLMLCVDTAYADSNTLTLGSAQTEAKSSNTNTRDNNNNLKWPVDISSKETKLAWIFSFQASGAKRTFNNGKKITPMFVFSYPDPNGSYKTVYGGDNEQNFSMDQIIDPTPIPSKYFKVTWKNNVYVGTATVTVTGKAPYYKGSKKLTFKITKGTIANPANTAQQYFRVKPSTFANKTVSLKVKKSDWTTDSFGLPLNSAIKKYGAKITGYKMKAYVSKSSGKAKDKAALKRLAKNIKYNTKTKKITIKKTKLANNMANKGNTVVVEIYAKVKGGKNYTNSDVLINRVFILLTK